MREEDQIKLDFDRAERIGFSEAVYAETKSVRQLTRILEQAAGCHEPILLTRLTASQHEALPAEVTPILKTIDPLVSSRNV
jgi:pyridinium-3,5-biscarboxylic acid mononucleotide synthase